MFVFKILLIILIALPVIALSSFFFMQMLGFIKDRNKAEDEMIRKSVMEEGPGTTRKRSKKERRR